MATQGEKGGPPVVANVVEPDPGANETAHAEMAQAEVAQAEVAQAEVAQAEVAHAEMAYAEVAHAEMAHAEVAQAEMAQAEVAHAGMAQAVTEPTVAVQARPIMVADLAGAVAPPRDEYDPIQAGLMGSAPRKSDIGFEIYAYINEEWP